MRQAMYDNKTRRRDRHDDVINVGTSRGASRRHKTKGEPISIPTNKVEEPPRSASRIARMHTSHASRIPNKPSVTVEAVKKTTRKNTTQSDESVVDVNEDTFKTKRRRLIRRIEEDDEEDEFIPTATSSSNTATSSSFIKPSLPRRRTLHSPLGNYAQKVPTLGQSIAQTSEFHRNNTSHEGGDGLAVLKEYLRKTAPKLKDNEMVDLYETRPAKKIATKKILEEEEESPFIVKKTASPVVLPFDPIDDYEIEPSGTDEHYLTYPFKAKKSVTVYDRDFERLNEETYINDTLIDVFPKIWADEFSNTSIYTFSSFFFTKLSGSHNTMHFDAIKRWTANEDIFEKKFLIIPIAQHNHWFLIVVANPGYCIQGPKGEKYHSNFEVEKEETILLKLKKRSIAAGTPLDRNKPYVVLLDPLHLNKPGAAKMIIRYLKEEANQKLNVDTSTEFVTPDIVMPACPGQDNFTDCGVFCLHYMKSLYQYTDEMMAAIYNNETQDETWDKDHTLPGFRMHLKRMLKRKMKEYRKYLFSKLE